MKPTEGTILTVARGGADAALIAADEEAVAAFLAKKIAFYDIFEVVCETVDGLSAKKCVHDLDEILASATEARAFAQSLISKRK